MRGGTAERDSRRARRRADDRVRHRERRGRDAKITETAEHKPPVSATSPTARRCSCANAFPAGADAARIADAPLETCALRLERESARGGAKAADPSSSSPPLRTRIVLDHLADAAETRADSDAADDAWLGAETRCVLESAPEAATAASPGGDKRLEISPPPAAEETPDPNARTTKVMFHYLYHRGRARRSEFTVGLTCPLCMFDADTFGALSTHMDACHGRFKFAFFPRGDAGSPERRNIGRPRKNGRGESVKKPVPSVPSSGDESGDSAPLVTLVDPRPDPVVHVMCREEDENAREQAERDDWEWFHKHGGWYTGNRARRAHTSRPRSEDTSDGSEGEGERPDSERRRSETANRGDSAEIVNGANGERARPRTGDREASPAGTVPAGARFPRAPSRTARRRSRRCSPRTR